LPPLLPPVALVAFALKNNLIQNCWVAIDDARQSILIYGLDVASIKGKTMKGQDHHVPTFAPTDLPLSLLIEELRNKPYVLVAPSAQNSEL